MAKKNILFVDDEEDVRKVVEILLKKAGYNVSVESDGEFIHTIDKDELPDMFLLDRRLGNKDALEICYILKAHAKTKHLPVIMVSADPTLKDLYQAAGADAFVPKPFDIKFLLDTIASFL